ncbi:alpha-ketoglutarate-dependent sulfonate dioxygenase [Meredithblackwellia eburnea MCA 4105]
MPPTATETIVAPLQTLRLEPQPAPATAIKASKTAQVAEGSPEWKENYKYKRFLPTYSEDYGQLPAVEPFEHVDPGHKALKHTDPRSFLQGGEIDDLTPDFGSEVSNVQLSKLTPEERDQLALYVAQRGVVAFRDQDFIDADPTYQLDTFGRHFGRLHVHPTTGQPAEFPELHLVYRDAEKATDISFSDRVTSTAWHSDVTYELQPPGLTALFLYTSPEAGGDTGYADQRGSYNHLSPNFRAYLETLSVVHSGVAQANYAKAQGNPVKREPVENVHPLVRTHPVTGEKALFVNPVFSRRIVGLKVEESDALLNFLYDHIAKGTDFQTRVRWKPRTVVLWDNRVTSHTAIADFKSTGKVRHGARITPQAERPFLKKDSDPDHEGMRS